jgi:IS5 family transposase
MEQLLVETLETAKRHKHLTERHMERVNVDTTVQEKSITYLTDSRLYHKARVLLVKAAKKHCIALQPELPAARQAYPAHVRPLRACSTDEAGQARAEETEDLPESSVSQHPA